MTATTARARWVVAGFVVLAVGFAFGRATVQRQVTEPVGRTENSAPAVHNDRRPSVARGHVPRPTPEGAVVAATSYAVALDGPDLFDPMRRARLIGRVAAAEARDELETSLGAVTELLTEQLGLSPDVIDDESFVWRAVPAGWRIVSYDGDDATVAVWGTGIAMRDGRLLAPIAWRTTLVDVTWQQSEWRLAGVRSDAGPEPPRTSDGRADHDVASEIRHFSRFTFLPGREGDA